MPYLVTRQFAAPRQVSIDDILNDIDNQHLKTRHVTVGGTMTRIVDYIPYDVIRKMNIPGLIAKLQQFNQIHEDLFAVKDRNNMYREFYIPKKGGGGLRKINAPNSSLKAALTELKILLEEDFNMLYHTAAYAYVKKRSPQKAVQRHQANESKWFLHTDFSGFFPSTTLEFTMQMLGKVFPFSEVVKREEGRQALEKALSLGFLDGALPQGSPLSPSLTNAIMIPIDHRLANYFGDRQMVYTRYADDISVSCRVNFNYHEIVAFINQVVRDEFGAPYFIKPEKTHYGSLAGRNWMLGLMLNKDNEITIGHKRKKEFKAMVCNYIGDWKNGIQWDLESVQGFSGTMSYYRMVEPDYISHVIDEYNKKFGVNLLALLKRDLGGRHMAT